VLEGRIGPSDSKPLVAIGSLPVDLQINYVAGGGAAALPVRVSALVRGKQPSFPDSTPSASPPPARTATKPPPPRTIRA